MSGWSNVPPPDNGDRVSKAGWASDAREAANERGLLRSSHRAGCADGRALRLANQT